MTRLEVESRVQRTFANAGIDVQAWPWWAWIEIIVDQLVDTQAKMAAEAK